MKGEFFQTTLIGPPGPKVQVLQLLVNGLQSGSAPIPPLKNVSTGGNFDQVKMNIISGQPHIILLMM